MLTRIPRCRSYSNFVNNYQEIFHTRDYSKCNPQELSYYDKISKKWCSELSLFEKDIEKMLLIDKCNLLKKHKTDVKHSSNTLKGNEFKDITKFMKKILVNGNKFLYKSRQVINHNKSKHGLFDVNNVVQSINYYFVRHFSCSKILYLANDIKDKEKEPISFKKLKEQISDCKVTATSKRENNIEKVFYKIECKENENKTSNFNGNSLSTGQRLVRTVLALITVIVAAYSCIFFVSLAATVVICLAILVFISTCYQILKKGFGKKKR